MSIIEDVVAGLEHLVEESTDFYQDANNPYRPWGETYQGVVGWKLEYRYNVFLLHRELNESIHAALRDGYMGTHSQVITDAMDILIDNTYPEDMWGDDE